MKIANRDARQYVQKQHPFDGSNLYGSWFCVNPSSIDSGDNGYVVCSYGPHWPLFIYVNDTWFENSESHSRSTTRHRSQTHPHCPTVLLTKTQMLQLYRGGYKTLAKARILGTTPSKPREQRDPSWLSAHGM